MRHLVAITLTTTIKSIWKISNRHKSRLNRNDHRKYQSIERSRSRNSNLDSIVSKIPRSISTSERFQRSYTRINRVRKFRGKGRNRGGKCLATSSRIEARQWRRKSVGSTSQVCGGTKSGYSGCFKTPRTASLHFKRTADRHGGGNRATGEAAGGGEGGKQRLAATQTPATGIGLKKFTGDSRASRHAWIVRGWAPEEWANGWPAPNEFRIRPKSNYSRTCPI